MINLCFFQETTAYERILQTWALRSISRIPPKLLRIHLLFIRPLCIRITANLLLIVTPNNRYQCMGIDLELRTLVVSHMTIVMWPNCEKFTLLNVQLNFFFFKSRIMIFVGYARTKNSGDLCFAYFFFFLITHMVYFMCKCFACDLGDFICNMEAYIMCTV